MNGIRISANDLFLFKQPQFLPGCSTYQIPRALYGLLLPICPKHYLHYIISFLILYYLNVKYLSLTLIHFFLQLPLCRFFPVTYKAQKEYKLHGPKFTYGSVMDSWCDLKKLYNLPCFQLPHLKIRTMPALQGGWWNYIN